MLAYDQWVLGQLLGDMETLPTSDPTALGRMAHVICSEELWIARLLGEDVSQVKPVWPDYTVAQCREKLEPVGKKPLFNTTFCCGPVACGEREKRIGSI